MYQCPCYLYPIRTGSRERPSYTITVDLKSGTAEPEHWIKRGTALLLSLAT
jgi:dynein heavy chain